MEERDSGGDEMGKGGGGAAARPSFNFSDVQNNQIFSCNLHETFFPRNPFFFSNVTIAAVPL